MSRLTGRDNPQECEGLPVWTPIYVLLVLGTLLIVFGILAVFKIAPVANSIFKWLGLELTTPVPGLVMIVIGAVMVFQPVTQLMSQKPTITDVALLTDTGGTSAQYGVRCPISIPLQGRISIGQTGGTVSYRFMRTHGLNQAPQPTEVRQLNFDGPGTATVTDTITVSIPEGDVFVSDYLEIVEPDSRRSEAVEIWVHCDPTLPDGPPWPAARRTCAGRIGLRPTSREVTHQRQERTAKCLGGVTR